jgi:hypothetical protein
MSLALLAIPVAPLVGAWLHELTHATAAVVLGGRYDRIDLRRLHVDFSVPTARRESAVRWAPFAVGQAALPAIVTLEGWVLLTALMGWTVYTWLGGRREPGLPWAAAKVQSLAEARTGSAAREDRSSSQRQP